MNRSEIIAFLKEKGEEDIETLLANRPKQERLKLLKDVESYEQYIGYAGEFRVMSELLVHGVNAINGRVDNGFDVTAFKEDEVFLIQVKTGFLTKENRYSFNIQADDVAAKYSGKHKIVYIFVLVGGTGEKMNCLVLPKEEFEKQRKAGNVWYTESTKRYKIKIYLRDRKALFGKVDNDLSEFLDDWTIFTGEKKSGKKVVV